MVPLMSFWPSVYKRILNQEKLIEYRRRFPKDCKYAYMYISKPVKAICGIIYFGRMHSLEDWAREFKDDPQIMSRIQEYSDSYNFGMEIVAIQKINPISLDELRKNITGFTAPQSYLLLENNEKLKHYIESHVQYNGEKIVNDLENIFPKHICLKDE